MKAGVSLPGLPAAVQAVEVDVRALDGSQAALSYIPGLSPSRSTKYHVGFFSRSGGSPEPRDAIDLEVGARPQGRGQIEPVAFQLVEELRVSSGGVSGRAFEKVVSLEDCVR